MTRKMIFEEEIFHERNNEMLPYQNCGTIVNNDD